MPTEVSDSPDMESGIPKAAPSKAVLVLEAAALLTLWSLLVINEGAIRFIRSTPSDLYRPLGSEDMSPYLVFFGGLLEVLFGILGLFVGLSTLLFRAYSTLLTKITMAVQTVLGIFVFTTFVFVEPIVRSMNLITTLPLDVSTSTYRFLITLGIFTSFHFCLALQGGQFLFMARLVAAATQSDFLKQHSGNPMRAVFWNANIALAGLWTMITGAVLVAQVGPDVPYRFPPNVGTLPGLTVATGLTLLIWGCVGALMGSRKIAPAWYAAGTAFVYILATLNFGIGQFGTLGNPAVGTFLLLFHYFRIASRLFPALPRIDSLQKYSNTPRPRPLSFGFFFLFRRWPSCDAQRPCVHGGFPWPVLCRQGCSRRRGTTLRGGNHCRRKCVQFSPWNNCCCTMCQFYFP